MGGALPAPVTAYIYDWNMLPIGQVLWLKELETYKEFPAAAGSGELQPGPGHGTAQEDAVAPEPVVRVQADAVRHCSRRLANVRPQLSNKNGGRSERIGRSASRTSR